MTLAPGLYLVATPIGNLRDITLRALDVLAEADLVLAEDTRVAAKLLAAHGLAKPVERYDDHSGARARPKALAALAAGARVALTSDAGTPLVSDPGYRLVSDALERGIAVHPIPGASAALAALAVSGLPTDRFLFLGFPPPRAAARRTFLREIAGAKATLVFFEGPSRLAASLADMAEVLGPRPAAVARELTKRYETVVRGSLRRLAADPALARPRGEITIVVGRGPEEPPSQARIDARLREALSAAPPSKAAAQVAAELGIERRAAYARALELKTT